MTTLDERALIARLEAADARELAVLLARPTAEEQKAYRAYLGDERYQRQHDLAVMVGASERGLFSVFGGATPTAKPLGNVVVLPGIMGSELTSVDRAGDTSRIWLNIPRIIAGQIERLRLTADGLSEFNSQFDVRPSGILKASYGELLLALSRSWNVRAFWYDWRKDLNQVADDLRTKLSQWFGDQPVHLVAHSMGGLVARTFIKRHADRWKSMWDANAQTPGAQGGRLIMLGTPNHGAYLIPQAATGLAATVHKLDLVDPWHDRAALLQILNSFVGLFQMLPSPKFDPDAAALYDVKTYGNRGVSSDCLKLALDHHQKVLDEDGDKDRMVYIAGDNQPTLAGIAKGKPIDDKDSYLFTERGDGSVSHKLGLLNKVPTYYVVSEHSALTAHPQILEALGPLLQGRPVNLSGSPQATRGFEDKEERLPASSQVAKDYQMRTEADLERVRTLAPRLRSRSLTLVRLTDEAELRTAAQRVRGGLGAEEAAVEARRLRALADRIEAQEALACERIGPEERELADRLARDFVTCPETPAFTAGAGGEEGADALAEPRPSVEIRLMYGSIDKPIEDPIEPDAPLVDAIAAGFYQGTTWPSTTLEALDRAISAVPGKEPSPRRILHDFTDRRILRGELGQPFFLDDPRAPDLHRVVAIAGLGPVGSCGVPELTVAIRELCWSLGQMRKKHLLAVLIGSGRGNLTARDAVDAWLRGIKRALIGYHDRKEFCLQRVTFIEDDPLKLRGIQQAILDTAQLEKDELDAQFQPIARDTLRQLELEGLEGHQKQEHERLEALWKADQGTAPAEDEEAWRRDRVTLSVSLKHDLGDAVRTRYCFAAMTEEASVPEREVLIDSRLVERANTELAGESDPGLQRDRGHFLGEFLIPRELRPLLSTDRPLVLMLDDATARIHWELIAQPDPALQPDEEDGDEDEAARTRKTKEKEQQAYEAQFLGTARGLTRQLRTSFASPPEPLMAQRHTLRVLVVADPAEDAPLQGAEAEGIAVAELFERFNTLPLPLPPGRPPVRFTVTRFLGPCRATRTDVLRELSVRPYDVLHYAGHCYFNKEQPSLSGWIFNAKNKEILSANELQRIDRVPRFIFSNACESGITPDRSEDRTAELAPSFAEAFFKQGVANFVCTAWPVGDVAALTFARTLYAELLGLELGSDLKTCARKVAGPAPMYRAMQRARQVVAATGDGRKTWGAYQHYGNPYFQLLQTLQSGSS